MEIGAVCPHEDETKEGVKIGEDGEGGDNTGGTPIEPRAKDRRGYEESKAYVYDCRWHDDESGRAVKWIPTSIRVRVG